MKWVLMAWLLLPGGGEDDIAERLGGFVDSEWQCPLLAHEMRRAWMSDPSLSGRVRWKCIREDKVPGRTLI